VNDIRLVATFEVEAGATGDRAIGRAKCEPLADALAQDLVRQVEDAGTGLLVVAGALFEPAALLRPGFPAWQALEELSKSAFRSPGMAGVMAIGAHQGRLPDARLAPESSAAGGQLLVMPLLLRSREGNARELNEQLESILFERGGLHPPTRAAFSQAAGLDTGHGQLMTLNDLVAMTHVQMDTAGLGAFWPVVEQVLIRPEDAVDFDLPGQLQARWDGATQRLIVEFRTFDDFYQARAGEVDDYALWTRAFRSLSALLSLHGIEVEIDSRHTLDESRRALIEASGPSQQGAGLTEQVHPDCGLLCWTLVEDGTQFNLYPVDSAGIALLNKDFAARGLEATRPNQGLEIDGEGRRLLPAA
jgi:hypothetical protein